MVNSRCCFSRDFSKTHYSRRLFYKAIGKIKGKIKGNGKISNKEFERKRYTEREGIDFDFVRIILKRDFMRGLLQEVTALIYN